MNDKAAGRKKLLKNWLPAFALGAISILLVLMYPESRQAFTGTVSSYALEMITIFPAVLVLMGLMSVFISNQFISRHLGSESGARGMVISFLLGTLPTGPLYMAFPLAASLKKKGARTANLVIFLSAWACIKLPQELVELRFLGPRFMVTRLLLTLVMVTAMGLLIEGLEKRRGKQDSDRD